MKSFSGYLNESLTDYVRSFASMATKQNMKKEWRHPAILLRDHGRIFPFDPVASFMMKRGQAKMCYRNAGNLALEGHYTYVEGYVSVHGVPIAHAWCATKKGMVIETTMQYGDAIGEYYGVPIKTDYLRKAILRNRVWGLLDAFSNPDILTAKVTDIVQR